nr:DUF3772 domain-containing protein [Verticiella sp. GG226]
MLLLLWCMAPVLAQAQGDPLAEVQRTLEAARKQVDVAREALGKDSASDAELSRLRDAVQSAQGDASQAAGALAPQVESLQARLQQLGPVPAEGSEAPDVASQRRELEKSFTGLDAQLKLARLLIVEADQVSTQISGMRRAGFQAQLGERTASVLDGAFWDSLDTELPADMARLAELAGAVRDAAGEVPERIWWLVALGAAGLAALRWWLGRHLVRLAADRVPSGRLRRSFHAVALLTLDTATPVLVLLAIRAVLRDHGAMPEALGPLMVGVAVSLAFGGFVVGLGHALLCTDRPTWRLPPLPDPLARRLRWLPWRLATVLVAAWLADRATAALDASLITVVVLNALVAAALCGVLGVALWRGEQIRRLAARDPDIEMPALPWWLSLLVTAAWATLALSVIGLLLGYIALASFLAKQLAWTLVVLCSAYLVSVFVEDVVSTALGARGDAGENGSRRDQAAVLVSGLVRVLIALASVALLLAPFGEGPEELIGRFGIIRDGVSIGAVTLRPGAVLQAAAVFILTLAGVGLMRRWLFARYLPTTGMDEGMRSSAATLFGYVGFVAAVALALIAVGIGLERVAWIASALSVGIGFGLQAVVQNFVSGLILLAERPVKVGDWVAIGGVEGDIRRINARATEIQMSDHSTLIVPNSEFITKTVRNVTHTNPLGVVSVKLPMPLDTSAEVVREIGLAVFAEHESVLDTPPPAVYLEGITDRSLMFNLTGYVASPRTAYGVRSAVLFTLLERLREAEVTLPGPEVATAAVPPAPPPRPLA